MASLDFAKYSKNATGEMGVHFDEEKRKTYHHANKHINPELSDLNYMLGTKSWQESVDRLNARTSEVDAKQPPKRVKADRVVCDMCYVPCPHEIEDKDKFFKMSYEFLVNKFGSENVHGGFVHKDEVHEYRDSRVRDEDDHQAFKLSMEHMHVMVSPYTEEHGINGKAFNSKKMFTEIQKEFDELVHKEFGISYHTGEQALGLKVEELKRASELLVQQEKEIQKLKEEKAQLEENLNDVIESYNNINNRIDELLSTFPMDLKIAKEMTKDRDARQVKTTNGNIKSVVSISASVYNKIKQWLKECTNILEEIRKESEQLKEKVDGITKVHSKGNQSKLTDEERKQLRLKKKSHGPDSDDF